MNKTYILIVSATTRRILLKFISYLHLRASSSIGNSGLVLLWMWSNKGWMLCVCIRGACSMMRCLICPWMCHRWTEAQSHLADYGYYEYFYSLRVSASRICSGSGTLDPQKTRIAGHWYSAHSWCLLGSYGRSPSLQRERKTIIFYACLLFL